MSINLEIYKIGLQSSISHNIAQNLNADSGFDVNEYIGKCRQLFANVGMEESLINEVIDVAVDQAKLEYAMGIVQSYGSAQLTPEIAYEYAIEEFKRIFVR